MLGKNDAEGERVRSVVFDLDGTLIDSAPAIARVLNAMRTEKGMTPAGVDAFRGWISLGAPELLRRALDIGPEETPARLDAFRRRYRAEPTQPDHLFPGVARTLIALRRRGLRMAICSNKPAPLCRKIVDDLDLAGCFDAVVGGEPDRPAKPDPAALDHALAAMGADARETLFVGDSSIDQKAAASRGVPFVFFASGYDDGVARGEVFRVINRMDELLELVQ